MIKKNYKDIIKEIDSLKDTKLYENSFKAIDDCIHLLYCNESYFKELEFTNELYSKKEKEKYNHNKGDVVVSKNINCGSYEYTILIINEVVDHRYIKGDVIASNKYKVGPYDVLWNRIQFEKICGPIKI